MTALDHDPHTTAGLPAQAESGGRTLSRVDPTPASGDEADAPPRGKHKLTKRPAKKPRRASARGKEHDYRPARLALRGVDGYLTRTAAGMTAWFVEPPVAWSMRKSEDREARIIARAQRLAELGEQGITEVHMRVTHRPWPVGQWALDHDQWARAGSSAPPGDVPDALSWDELMHGEQRSQYARVPTNKTVYWGLALPGRSTLAQGLESFVPATTWAGPLARALGRQLDRVLDAEVTELLDELRALRGIMAAPGVQAHPANPDQMRWLLTRSATLGLPPREPERSPNDAWEIGDLAALVDAAEVDAEPRAGCVRVTGVVGGRRHERFVSVLTVGPMGELAIPEQQLPWLVWGDALGWPIEASARIRFPSDDVTRRSLNRQVNKIMSQQRHYAVEHGKEVPPDLADKVARATWTKSELDHDHTRLSTRTESWWRLAVSGSTEEQVLDRAEQLSKAFAPVIKLEQADGQYQQYREFMPGEKLSSTAHRRRMSVRVVAASLPSVTDRLGDRHGPRIAETASLTGRPVCWDMWYAMEVGDKSGLTPIVGGLGSGKTHLAGMLVYRAVRAGAHGIALDPSGPLRRLAELPELKPYTRLIDLMNAAPGTLNPYRVIANPLREEQQSDAEFEAELRATAAERREFVRDILRMLLDAEMQDSPEVGRALDQAVGMVGGADDRDPGMVITALSTISTDPTQTVSRREAAGDVARKLDELRDLREVRLLFPQAGLDGWQPIADHRLTLLTLPGLQLPNPDSDKRNWTLHQRLAVPLMHLASWLTHRLIYSMPRDVRKIVFLDEMKQLSGYGAGQVLFTRLERDTRKFDVRALIASQLAADFLSLPGFEALTHEVIVGSVQGDTAIDDSLKLLRLASGYGWGEMIRGLNSAGGTREDTHDPDALAAQALTESGPREYVMRVGDDVEIIRVDYRDSPHLAHVVAALDSSPTGRDVKAHAARQAAASPSKPVPSPAAPSTPSSGVWAAGAGR